MSSSFGDTWATMLSTEGILLLPLNRTAVNSVLAKYFLILVMTQQMFAQSSIEGYAEAYRVRSEKEETEGAYKDAYIEDGNDYAETVVDYMHQVLDKDQHKKDSHEHDNKGDGNNKDSQRGETKAEPTKKDHDDYNYHQHGDYEYMDEPENEAGHLDPEVEHIIQC